MKNNKKTIRHEKTIFFACLLLVLTIMLMPKSSAWYSTAYKYRTEINITSVPTISTNTAYPYKLVLNTSVINYSYFQLNGGDFTPVDSDDTTKLSYFIEKWNSTGTSIIYVNVSVQKTSDKTIYLYSNTTTPQVTSSSFNNTFGATGFFASYNFNSSDLSDNRKPPITSGNASIITDYSLSLAQLPAYWYFQGNPQATYNNSAELTGNISTWCAKFKTTDSSGALGIIDNCDATFSGYLIRLNRNESNNNVAGWANCVYMDAAGTTAQIVGHNGAYNDGNWHSVCCLYNSVSKNLSMVADGLFVRNRTINTPNEALSSTFNVPHGGACTVVGNGVNVDSIVVSHELWSVDKAIIYHSNPSFTNNGVSNNTAKPEISNLTLLPSTAYVTSTYNCSALFTDNDSTMLNVTFSWTGSGSQTFTNIGNNTFLNVTFTPGTPKGSVEVCNATINDGLTSVTGSVNVTVSNTPPAGFNITNPQNGSLVFGNWTTVSWTCSDADNDTRTLYLSVNGTPNATATNGTSFNLSTLIFDTCYNLSGYCNDSSTSTSSLSRYFCTTSHFTCDITTSTSIDGMRYADNNINTGILCGNGNTVLSCNYSINDYAPVTPANCSSFNITAELGKNDFNISVAVSGGSNSTMLHFWAKKQNASLWEYPAFIWMFLLAIGMIIVGFVSRIPLMHGIAGLLIIFVGFELFAFSVTFGIVTIISGLFYAVVMALQ